MASYDQWLKQVTEQDQDKIDWKLNPISPHYNYQLISDRLQQMRTARSNKDIDGMLHLLRTSLQRNLGDMGNPLLYTYTRVGTKVLIEEYIEEVVKQLQEISATDRLTLDEKLATFQNIRQLQGRTALLLSGGATLGLIHTGVIQCLMDLKLLPRVISGSSVGSLIAAIVGTKNDVELKEFLDKEQFYLQAIEGKDEEGSILAKLDRFIKEGVLFDEQVLQTCIKTNIGDVTFQEAYNRTRRVLNITVSSSTQYEMPKLLNYLTAPDVLVWSAVAASCSIPLLYKSAPLLSRNKYGQIASSAHLCIDGSVESDLPMARLSEMFNVNHFIVSQTNPHVVPLLKLKPPQLLFKFATLITTEVQHRLSQLIELEIFPTALSHVNNIISQKYHGDVTILPELNAYDFLRLIKNPTKETLYDAMLRGQRATWPKISIIRNHCQIELFLDECLYKLRCQKLEQGWSGEVGSLELPEHSMTIRPRLHQIASQSTPKTQEMHMSHSTGDLERRIEAAKSAPVSPATSIKSLYDTLQPQKSQLESMFDRVDIQ